MPKKSGHYEIGRVYRRDGQLIYITSGRYMGTMGLSNHWNWKYVRKNGTLGRDGWGYGDFPAVPVECDIQIKIKLKEDGISLG